MDKRKICTKAKPKKDIQAKDKNKPLQTTRRARDIDKQTHPETDMRWTTPKK